MANDPASLLPRQVVNVVFTTTEEGVVAQCVEIPGCISQGDTLDEAKANIADAIEACYSVIIEDYLKATRCPAGESPQGTHETFTLQMVDRPVRVA